MKKTASDIIGERKIKIVLAAVVVLLVPLLCFLILREKPLSWEEIGPEIKMAAAKHQVPPELVEALIWRESKFYQFSRGKCGEIGLMQLHTRGSVADWARWQGRSIPADKELFAVKMNLDIGCWYLAGCLKRYAKYTHGTELALAQYNAGARRADKYKPEDTDGEVIERITINSTRNYVQDIIKRYQQNKIEKIFSK